MSLDELKELIPDFAKDLRLNLGSVLTPQGAPGLSQAQVWMIAVASAIASRNVLFAKQLEGLAREHLDERQFNAARSAASIMAMNNIYYRFVHMVEETEYQSMPARLRMNVLGNSGVDKVDFELMSLAVSAVNGCGMCVTAHEKTLRSHDGSRESVQSAVRIAAVVHAVAGVLEYVRAA